MEVILIVAISTTDLIRRHSLSLPHIHYVVPESATNANEVHCSFPSLGDDGDRSSVIC